MEAVITFCELGALDRRKNSAVTRIVTDLSSGLQPDSAGSGAKHSKRRSSENNIVTSCNVRK